MTTAVRTSACGSPAALGQRPDRDVRGGRGEGLRGARSYLPRGRGADSAGRKGAERRRAAERGGRLERSGLDRRVAVRGEPFQRPHRVIGARAERGESLGDGDADLPGGVGHGRREQAALPGDGQAAGCAEPYPMVGVLQASVSPAERTPASSRSPAMAACRTVPDLSPAASASATPPPRGGQFR